MYLKSIELTGFKSFAKKSKLQFTSPISAIVGPNGSGKSNIAEAFRFVLGEQSIKSLRGKKGEDLIWNGTADLPKGNRASVKVSFDNRTKFLGMEYETVTIERIVYRDGVNQYLINGSQVRLKDTIELLASAHIGSSGHHIISQGEADRILNASIKERRTMVEDALGLKLYQYKKKESVIKLEKTDENIKQVELLRREIAPHLRFLQKQTEIAEKALELRKGLTEKSLEYLKREDEHIKKTESNLELEIKPISAKEKELNAELEQARSILQKASHKDEKSEELVGLEKKLRDVRGEKEEILRQSGALDGEISSLSKMIKKQKDLQQTIEHKTVPLAWLEDLKNKIESKFVKSLDEIISLLTDFIDTNKEKIDNSLLSDVQGDLNNLKNSKKVIETKFSEIKNKEASLEREAVMLKDAIEKEKDTNRDAEKEVFRIMAELREIRLNLQRFLDEESRLKFVKEDFKRQLSQLGALLGPAVLRFEHLVFPAEPNTNQEERRKEIEKIKIRLEEAGGDSGGDVLKEYREASERDKFLEKELSDLQKSRTALRDLITDLDERLTTEFKTGVEKINSQFKQYFALMFGGGEARLSVISAAKRKKTELEEITEEMEEAEEGIDIEVNLPKKKVKGLMMLSGGERALTSIALIFAITQSNPPPFIILDETDAALDEANSKKYGDMIENLAKFSQLIVITHNRETMSRAGILYGVAQASAGGSKLLSVSFDTAVEVAK